MRQPPSLRGQLADCVTWTLCRREVIDAGTQRIARGGDDRDRRRWCGKWPVRPGYCPRRRRSRTRMAERLTSGVIFYEGERITKAEFMAEVGQ